jgi:hypothetical protein
MKRLFSGRTEPWNTEVKYVDSKYTLSPAIMLSSLLPSGGSSEVLVSKITRSLVNKIIFGEGNQYNIEKLCELGFEYYQIGGGN